MQILTIKQTTARESLLQSRHYSLSMTTVTSSKCSQDCQRDVLGQLDAITLQYESKPLTTTASSAYTQPSSGNHSVQTIIYFRAKIYTYTTKSIIVACSMLQKKIKINVSHTRKQ